MIVRNAMQTKYLHPASNVNAGSWVKGSAIAQCPGFLLLSAGHSRGGSILDAVFDL